MQENPVKQRLAAGGRALGSMIFEFFTPGLPRSLKNAGAEYALYCMEHTGAGLDVFEDEPTPASNPILRLDNVIVAPHALAWTDELFANIARAAVGAVVDVHARRRPKFLVNPEALAHPRARGWLHL